MKLQRFRMIFVFLIVSTICSRSFAGNISNALATNGIDGVLEQLKAQDLSKMDSEDIKALKESKSDVRVANLLLARYREALEQSPFSEVPKELILLISSILDLPDLVHMSQTCHQMHDLTAMEVAT